jgi:ferredoxin
MAKNVYVEQELCIGCGICAGNLPAVFRMSFEERAEVHDQDGASVGEIQSQTIDVCPVSCICWS